MTQAALRRAKRRLSASLRRLDAGEIDKMSVVAGLDEDDFTMLTQARLANAESLAELSVGVPISPGVTSGRVWSDLPSLLADESGDPAILMCTTVHNSALAELRSIAGVIAVAEDPSSHAAIVMRVNGVPAISIAGASKSDEGVCLSPESFLKNGSFCSIDGHSGRVYSGLTDIVEPDLTGDVAHLMEMLVELAPLRVHANADTAADVADGLRMWATGFEPRAEHMLLQGDKLFKLQLCLIAPEEDRAPFLEGLRDALGQELSEVYRIAGSRPVFIRLLDPPIHEFLPATMQAQAALAESLGLSVEALVQRTESLAETNPMLGTRGARLLIRQPDLLVAQVEAILNAANDSAQRLGEPIVPHITVPMVVDGTEVAAIRSVVDHCIAANAWQKGGLKYKLGAMLETPRAALCADRLAEQVDYISYGTNDLTALVFAFSRGDVYARFLAHYLEAGLLEDDPFSTLDGAVRTLMDWSLRALRSVKPALHIGVCGEHAGTASGLDYCVEKRVGSVSVSPKLIPQTLFRSIRG